MIRGPTRQEAKRIILAIVREAGGVLVARTRLYKVFYHAHLFYWQDHGGLLTLYPIVHMPHGPGIDDGEGILRELESGGQLEATRDPSVPLCPWVYRLSPQASVTASPSEQDAIQKALIRVGSGRAVDISERSHEDSWSWHRTKKGHEQNIYSDLLDEADRRALEERQQHIQSLLTSAGF